MIHMYTFIGVIASYIYEIKLLFIVSFKTPTHDDSIIIVMLPVKHRHCFTDDCFSSVVSKKDNKVVQLVVYSKFFDSDKILITLECSDSTFI